MAHSGVRYIFERRRGPKRRGARDNLPPYPAFSTGLPKCAMLHNCSQQLHNAHATTHNEPIALKKISKVSIKDCDQTTTIC